MNKSLAAGVDWSSLAASCGRQPVAPATSRRHRPHFTLTAKADQSAPRRGQLYCWGYAERGRAHAVPRAHPDRQRGGTVTVTLTNALPATPANVSIVFPGQQVTAIGGTAGPAHPGSPAGGRRGHLHLHRQPSREPTLYHSGTRSSCRWRWAWWARSSCGRRVSSRRPQPRGRLRRTPPPTAGPATTGNSVPPHRHGREHPRPGRADSTARPSRWT